MKQQKNKKTELHFKPKKKAGIVRKAIENAQEELHTTTTHGLYHIFDTNLSWFERSFWMSSFLFCFVMIFVLLDPLFTRFMAAPTVVSVEMNYHDWNVSFPAISLCPLNQLDGNFFDNIIADYEVKTGENLRKLFYSIVGVTLLSQDFGLDFGFEKHQISLIKPEEYSDIAAQLFPEFNNTSLMTSYNWPISVDTVMTEIGMCHVINSNVALFDDPNKWKDRNLKYSKNNIEISFFDGDFYVKILNYLDGGYRAYIHSPDELIHGSTPVYDLRNDGFLRLGVRVWSTKISQFLRSTPLGFRKCRFINEPISERYPVYSFSHCMLECRIRTIKRLCGCTPHFYRPVENETICSIIQLECVYNYRKTILSLSSNPDYLRNFTIEHKRHFNPTRECGCEVSCESDVYQIDDEEFTLSPEPIFKVNLASYPKVRLVRDIIFSVYDAILRSGGVVNLCIGSSIISVVELVFIIMRILFQTLYHTITRKSLDICDL